MTNITETERIVDKYTDKISGAIESLAETLKVPAEFVFETLIRVNFIQGISYLIIIIFTLICAIISINKGANIYKKEKGEGLHEPYIAIGCIALLACVISFGLGGATIVSMIFVPEYHAIMEIKGFIK